MLAAHCPSCGSPAPVSLATPDCITCPSCRYTGAPSHEVSAQLRAAANALFAMNEGDRQLSAAQRYNLNAARSSLLLMLGILVIVLVPLVGVAGSCSVLAVSGEGFEPMSLVMFVAGCLPFTIGVGAAILALRHVRNRGRGLAERCAALPPAGAGEPARCHVCGGSLAVAQKQGVVRCGFCRADNLVSDKLLRRMAARRSFEVGKLGEQVRSEARALDDSALTAGLLAVVVALLSPIVSVVFVVAIVLLGSEIELEPRDDATYALVQVTNASCIAEVRDGLDFRESVLGFDKRPLSLGLVTRKSHDFVGMELGYDDRQKGRVTRVYRDAISPSIDRVELDFGTTTRRVKLTSRCEVPKTRRLVATNRAFAVSSQLVLDGDQLWIQKLGELYRIPRAGGAIQETLRAPEEIRQFQPTPEGMLVIVGGDLTLRKRVVERWRGTEREELAKGDAFAVDGDALWIGSLDGLFRRDADGTLTMVVPSQGVRAIHVNRKAVYWLANGELYERDKAIGVVRTFGRASAADSMVVVGEYAVFGNYERDPSFVPLAGGTEVTLTGASFIKGRVATDGSAVYFGLESSSRGGVAAMVIGGRSATSDRHYGIDTGKVDAYTVGDGEVYWMVDDTLFAEPIVPE